MALKTSATPSGKKPAPAPRSAVSKRKHPPLHKSARSKSKSRAGSASKRHPAAAFSTLKSRQQAVERAKLQIWRHLPEINGAIIRLAESGSYLAARTLFDFAGVYGLPPLDQEAAPGCPSPALPGAQQAGASASELPQTPPQPVNKFEAFLQTLGLDPLSDEEPEPDVAA